MSENRLELQVLHAQLHDAIKDAQLWGMCDPSNEERLYISRMQRVISDWLGWVGRRLSDLNPIEEDQHASDYPSQFLQLYKKACEVRGVTVGEHLSRLADRIEAMISGSATVSPTKTESPEDVEHTNTKVKATTRRVKKNDLSQYLHGAKLTDKQHQCASLRWEYNLQVAEIARELKLHRKTVDEHLHAAQAKMQSSGEYQRLQRKLAGKRADQV